uniref:Growth differentiation factor 5 opposite strand n=1 Tax=Nothoprocta perdicaria TaxID=30464 RepID=A0A8C6Z0T2_NOTPE
IIQSSHPISLKFTWRAFLLHLAFRFLLGLFPCRVARGALLFPLISLKNKSLFFVLPNTKKRAFSLTCLPVLLNPTLLRSIALPLSKVSNSKHKFTKFLKFLKSFQMSNTSHFGVSVTLTVRASRSVAAYFHASEGFFLNIRSSAPSNPSFSNALMSKIYFCFLMVGSRSSKKSTHSFKSTSSTDQYCSAPWRLRAPSVRPGPALALTSLPQHSAGELCSS